VKKYILIFCILLAGIGTTYSAHATIDSDRQNIVVPENTIVVPSSAIVCRIRPIYGFSTVVVYELSTTLESLHRIEVAMESTNLHQPKNPEQAQQALRTLRAEAEQLKSARVCNFILDLFTK